MCSPYYSGNFSLLNLIKRKCLSSKLNTQINLNRKVKLQIGVEIYAENEAQIVIPVLNVSF